MYRTFVSDLISKPLAFFSIRETDGGRVADNIGVVPVSHASRFVPFRPPPDPEGAFTLYRTTDSPYPNVSRLLMSRNFFLRTRAHTHTSRVSTHVQRNEKNASIKNSAYKE